MKRRPPDWAAIERRAAGDRTVWLNSPELGMAVAALDAHGYSARFIADRLGIAERTVCRLRARNRQAAAA